MYYRGQRPRFLIPTGEPKENELTMASQEFPGIPQRKNYNLVSCPFNSAFNSVPFNSVVVVKRTDGRCENGRSN